MVKSPQNINVEVHVGPWDECIPGDFNFTWNKSDEHFVEGDKSSRCEIKMFQVYIYFLYIYLFLPLHILGEDFHFDSYFTYGLKPPTSSPLFWKHLTSNEYPGCNEAFDPTRC